MSRVTDWVEQTLAHNEGDPTAGFSAFTAVKRVTARINGLTYGKLRLVARKLDLSATGCAEELLSEALNDALVALGYASWEDALPEIRKEVESDLQEPGEGEEQAVPDKRRYTGKMA